MKPKLKIPKGWRQIRLGEKIPYTARVLEYTNYKLINRSVNPFTVGKRVKKDWMRGDFKIIIKK